MLGGTPASSPCITTAGREINRSFAIITPDGFLAFGLGRTYAAVVLDGHSN
jgi:hypothetical protein